MIGSDSVGESDHVIVFGGASLCDCVIEGDCLIRSDIVSESDRVIVIGVASECDCVIGSDRVIV